MFIKKNTARYKVVFAVISVLFLCLVIKIVYVQNMYQNNKFTTVYKGGTQTEKISELNYNVIDCSGKNLVDTNRKYVLVIDCRVFKMNNIYEQSDKVLAFTYIMKAVNDEFSLDDINLSNGKKYYELLEDYYNKLLLISKDIKGIYLYKYDAVNNTCAWGIENIFTQLKNKDKNTLDGYVYDNVKNNRNNILKASLNNEGSYNNLTYSVPENNNNVQLTIDKEWQDRVREVLASSNFSKLNNIGVAIMDSSSGELKVLAQKNEKKPNVLLGAEGLGYPPGSIFKVIVEMAAIKNNQLDLSEKYTCTGRYCKRDGKPNSHGTLSLYDALKVSCNECFMKLGNRVGFDKIVSMCSDLGLGKKVLNLSSEAKGSLPEIKSGINNISIGQTFNVTPLQMLAAYNAIANKGVYVKPYILKDFYSNKEKIKNVAKTDKTTIISEENAEIIKNQLIDVVNSGSGIKAKVEGITVGGKTGTAENGKNNDIWFSGFFKLNNKFYSMIIIVPDMPLENEDGELNGGGSTAAPIFHDIVDKLKI